AIQTHFDFSTLPSAQNLFGIIANKVGNVANGVLPDGGLLVMPTNPVLNADDTYSNTSGTINTSQGGGGVTIGNTNQAFDGQGEGAWFMYVDNPATAAVGTLGLTPTTADDADTIRFSGVDQATDASVSIVQSSGKGTAKSQGPALHITAYEANPGNVNSDPLARAEVINPTLAAANQGTLAPEVSITEVKIHNSAGTVIEDAVFDPLHPTITHYVTATGGPTGTGGPNDVQIAFQLDGSGHYNVLVSNLAPNETIEFFTATSHDLAKVTWASG